MTSIADINLLRKYIAFTFVDEVKNGMFVEKQTKSGFIIDLGNNHVDSASKHRVGIVKGVGEDVTGVAVGEKVVIQNLMWTPHPYNFEGELCWMTEQRYVIAKIPS